MTGFQLAQINVGRLKSPLDHPDLAPFVAALEVVNAVADSSPGFVWRLSGAGNDATDVRAFDDSDQLLNMSVWESLDALAAFVYRAHQHRAIMRRRAEFFTRPDVPTALWWVPAGHRPTPTEGVERLARLTRLGPTPGAFTFRQPFPAPGADEALPVLDECA